MADSYTTKLGGYAVDCEVKKIGIGSLTLGELLLGVDLAGAFAGRHVALAFDPAGRVVKPG